LNNKVVYGFLAGTLAIVLIAGLGSPSFAQQPITLKGQVSETSEEVFLPSADEADSIFDGGRANLADGASVFQSPSQLVADDFILDEVAFLTDVHLDVTQDVPDLLEFDIFIYDDDGGQPGSIIAQGVAINIEREFIIVDIFGGDTFRYWFDVEPHLLLQADRTYWLRIDQTNVAPFDALWWGSDLDFGNNLVFSLDDGDTWTMQPFGGLNFVLTGGQPVGGEIIPIQTTSLILAGAQTFSWMIPVVLSVLGIGLFVVSRKSENS